MSKSKARARQSANSGDRESIRGHITSAPALSHHAKLNLSNRVLSVSLHYFILLPSGIKYTWMYHGKITFVE
jgi:hypothetical protein